MDRRPVGVFDSGVGGLTVFKELEANLPHESLLYLGDTARVRTWMEKIGKVTEKQIEEIAKVKMADLNAFNLDAAKKIIAGTAKNMGLEIVGG